LTGWAVVVVQDVGKTVRPSKKTTTNGRWPMIGGRIVIALDVPARQLFV
jgi:hypothetical protein